MDLEFQERNLLESNAFFGMNWYFERIDLTLRSAYQIRMPIFGANLRASYKYISSGGKIHFPDGSESNLLNWKMTW